jgi:hypothetical protein
MDIFFTPLPIISATVFACFFGFLWYSPVLFLNVWIKANGLTKDKLPKRSNMYMASISVYSLIAHGAMCSVLALLFEIVQVTTLKMALSVGGLVALGFIVATRYIEMLYTLEGTHYARPQQIKFFVTAGYFLFVVIIMSTVLFFSAHI